jgi:hypothetical protein
VLALTSNRETKWGQCAETDRFRRRCARCCVDCVLPLNFVVTDIQPAPNNLAGATLETQATNPRPIVLVNRGGHWLIPTTPL